jgi:hypothetical protein
MDIMIEQIDESKKRTDGIPEIHEHESQRRYRLVGIDSESFEQTAQELFQGSNLLKNQTLWISNFKATISQVQKWCHDREKSMRLALVDVRSNKVLFYFVPESDRYDLSLGSEMTDLEVRLGGSAGIGHVETLQVPERSLDRFAPKDSREIWRRGQ